jgi:hypothetical protein
MEKVKFPVSSSEFLNGIIRQSDKFRLEDLVGILFKMTQLDKQKKTTQTRCSVKTGANGVVFSVNSEDVGNIFMTLNHSLGPEAKARFFKRLAKCIAERDEFKTGNTGASEAGEVSFRLEITATDLAGIRFDQMEKKSLVGLKKKVLEIMLGKQNKADERGRPVGGYLCPRVDGFAVEIGQEQSVSLLKKTLSGLTGDQLVALDSKLGGALTSFPEDQPQ